MLLDLLGILFVVILKCMVIGVGWWLGFVCGIWSKVLVGCCFVSGLSSVASGGL